MDPVPKNNRLRRCQSLPRDIIHDILLRLPAKSVARFRCVCTSWLSIGTDCSFLRAHCHCAPRSLIRQPAFQYWGLHRSYFDASHTCDFDSLSRAPELFIPADVFSSGRTAAIGKELSLPEKLHSTCVKPLASCDGLVILNTCKRGFYVLNPLTSQCTSLPTPHSHHELSSKNFGFYFHRWTGEYRLFSLYVEPFTNLFRPEVLSLGSKSWRITEPFQSVKRISLRFCPVYVDDFLHWIYFGPSGLVHLEILAFDIRAELFTRIALPPFNEDCKVTCHENGKRGWSFKVGLVDIEARLGFYLVCSDENRVKLDVWLLEDYAIKKWSKFYSAIFNHGFGCQLRKAFFDFHAKDGELLFVFDLPHKRFFIHCSMKSGNYFADEVSTDAIHTSHPTLIYKESLIFYDSFWNISRTKRFKTKGQGSHMDKLTDFEGAGLSSIHEFEPFADD